ncbi:MAG: hypothetical protein A2287_05635 [Candidatus Melainabacteria bacterium RIFOXYA12_FULL_32_12]|nr:MAG: hypothetical protein A2255_08140 [Candidatus Melainabacteria bacterium RIFOXYA2_FULL_32_9]OGI30272.1 MAG: hypothetical protein A2287_05635 [Candidatus Melainabacteria bacterium RIFOXYA12_FULL_32_12]
MEKCKISIIIPVYNGEKVIGDCLSTIYNCEINNLKEVMVIDDGSTDNTAKIVQNFPCKYVKIEKTGVANARNTGIAMSTGEILFFFDADVKLKKNTLEKFLKYFEEDKDAYIIQGRWDKNSPVSTFSSEFFLLKYHFNFLDLFKDKRRISVANLETGCMAIKREVFDFFEDFDTGYKFAGGEEHELGLRLLRKYEIFYYPDIFVEHKFGSILKTLNKIFFRTTNFAMLAFNAENKKFMNLHKNSAPNQDKISILLILLILFDIPVFLINFKIAIIVLSILIFSYIINIYRFLMYLNKEKDLFFAIKGGLSDFIIMIPRLFGLLRAIFIYYILHKKDYKI